MIYLSDACWMFLRKKLTEKMKLFYFTRKCDSYLFGLIIPYVNVLLLLQLLAEKGSFHGMHANEPQGLFFWLLSLCYYSSCLWPWITTPENPIFKGEKKCIDDKKFPC